MIHMKAATRNLRHKLVKALAPNLYQTYQTLLNQSYPRPMIDFIKQQQLSSLVGVEVGVWEAGNAENILQVLSMRKLYLVDPYSSYIQDGVRVLPEKTELLAHNRMRQHVVDGKVEFIRLRSVDAVRYIPDELDFVYVDADHSYRAVKQDVEAYFPKVRVGGVLGGHDFSEQFLGVCQVVNECVRKHGLELFVDKSDWWIVKS